MNRLEARGNLEVDTPAESATRIYRLSEYLTPENPLSLTDIQEALWSLSAPDALARYLDAVDYFESRRQDVLKKAAEGLMQEDPVELVLDMLRDKLARLQESLGRLRSTPKLETPSLDRKSPRGTANWLNWSIVTMVFQR